MNSIRGRLYATKTRSASHFATGEQFVPEYGVHTLCGRTLVATTLREVEGGDPTCSACLRRCRKETGE